jgi:hypothetical protein
MRKIRSLVTLDDEKAKALQDQVTDIIKRGLIGETPDGSSPREEVLKLLQLELGEKDVSLLREGMKDYRPDRDEPSAGLS